MFSRLAKPEVVEALGVSHVRGILLWGPPGCGKTTIARQIGAMLLMPEPKVVNGPEIVSKYLGESENKVRDLFRDAEENPNEHHLIVFDEIDALVKPRGRGQGEAADQVYDGIVNTLLSKMDGIDRLDNVLVVVSCLVLLPPPPSDHHLTHLFPVSLCKTGDDEQEGPDRPGAAQAGEVRRPGQD